MKTLLALCVLPALATSPLPCIWDKDTLADELRGLPGTFDLVTGRFHVHGARYYQVRVLDSTRRLKAAPDDLAAYDDLAVAYERLKMRDKAVATMAAKLRALSRRPSPEHQYRYHANLGTFHAHQGDFAKALVELRKAVQLNPDAHFGREHFQIDLIRYVQACRANPALWGEQNFLSWAGYKVGKRPFATFISKLSMTGKAPPQGDKAKTLAETVEGVGGMIRYGGIEGPELFRSLGDVFNKERHLHLAWWSYQRALERGHPAKAELRRAIASIEWHWKEAQKAVGGVRQVPTDARWRQVRELAETYRSTFIKLENEALAAGKDPSGDALLQELLRRAEAAAPRPAWAKAAAAAADKKAEKGQWGPANQPVKKARRSRQEQQGGDAQGAKRRDRGR